MTENKTKKTPLQNKRGFAYKRYCWICNDYQPVEIISINGGQVYRCDTCGNIIEEDSTIARMNYRRDDYKDFLKEINNG